MSAFRMLRLTEFFLLLFPAAIVSLGIAAVNLTRGQELTKEAMGPAIVFCGLLILVYLFQVIGRLVGDQALLPLVATLTGTGLILIYRLSESEIAVKQSTWIVLGLIAMVGTIVVVRDPVWLKRYKYTSALLGLFLVAITLVLGRDTNNSGARLWLPLPFFQFQPSEILKVLLVVFFAGYLDEYRELLSLGRYRLGPLSLPPLPYLLPLLMMWGLSLLLLVVQKDLGAALLFFGIFLSMLYVASSRMIYVLTGLVAFAGGAFVCYKVIDVVQRRVDIWLDPFATASGTGYQIIQGMVAFANGGIIGMGLGAGRPGFVPAIHTDFILAAAGEELGFIGTIAIVCLYILLVHRGFQIALRCENSFNQLLASGLTTVLALQTLVIAGGTLRLMPLTGITMPFMSYGGSSLLTNFIIIGLLLRISRVDGGGK